MSAQVTCPVCKTKYTVADNLLGKTIPCKKCQEPFVATATDDDAPAPPLRAERNPVLLFLVGAGAAAVFIGVLGTVAYLLWPEDAKPVVAQGPPPPAPLSQSPPSRPPTPPAPK